MSLDNMDTPHCDGLRSLSSLLPCSFLSLVCGTVEAELLRVRLVWEKTRSSAIGENRHVGDLLRLETCQPSTCGVCKTVGAAAAETLPDVS